MYNNHRIQVYIKISNKNEVLLSEITSSGISTTNIINNFDINAGCAGMAFKDKEIVFEPFAQSSEFLTRQELTTGNDSIIINNIVAVPIINEFGNSIGVFEAFNSRKSIFTDNTSKLLLLRFSRYISLLMYTNGLLRVF